MSTLKVTNVKHETSGLNTLVFDNGGASGGNGRVTTKGTIGEVSALGNLAAGKTTFIKGVLKGLGYQYEVTSPTFTLINEYYAKFKVIHIDFYREENIVRWNELGFQDIVNSDSIIMIEWADLIPDLIPNINYKLLFKHEGEDKRKINLK